jgi:hypothetical protein
LNFAPEVKAGRAEARMDISSPVLGFLPILAAVSIRLNVPKPAESTQPTFQTSLGVSERTKGISEATGEVVLQCTKFLALEILPGNHEAATYEGPVKHNWKKSAPVEEAQRAALP